MGGLIDSEAIFRWERAAGNWFNERGGFPWLLAGPLVAPSLLPHPGRRVGIGPRIEDISVGKWGARPRRAQELKQPEVRSGLVDRPWIEIRFTAPNAQQIFLRLVECASRLPDDRDDLILRRLTAVRFRFADLLDQTFSNPSRSRSMPNGHPMAIPFAHSFDDGPGGEPGYHLGRAVWFFAKVGISRHPEQHDHSP